MQTVEVFDENNWRYSLEWIDRSMRKVVIGE